MIATADDGTRLHYIVEGTGPPLVLVGGKTSDIDGAWWRYIPVLAKRLKVIAFDNRGSGASGKPDTPGRWSGVARGGWIFQHPAPQHPDAVRSLILGPTHWGGEPPPAGGAGA